jgi:histidinol-phosphatase (PHP family)
MANIAETAISMGLAGIAITDHYDPLWPDDDDPSFLDAHAYETALTETEALFSGRIRFSKVIELGLLPGKANEMCLEIVANYPYDFVIGSMHYSETTPIDYPPFIDGRSLEDIAEEYYTLLLEGIRNYKNYDVLGHINAIDRYTDKPAPESVTMPYIDEILKCAIPDGKGIEINTSSFGRYSNIKSHGTPTLPMLRRYRELGGEIVTVGSDAHLASEIGAFLDEGEELLHAAGFKYTTFYKGRTPEFFSL